MLFSTGSGLIAAVSAMVVFGISYLIVRLGSGSSDRFAYMSYWGIGVLLSHTLIAVSLDNPNMELFAMGLLGGAIVSVAGFFSMLATDGVGLAVGSAVWCGLSGVTGFIWSKGIWGQPVADMGLAVTGLGLIVVGVVFVSSMTESDASGPEEEEEQTPLCQSHQTPQAERAKCKPVLCCTPGGMKQPPVKELRGMPAGAHSNLCVKLIGVAYAAVCGVLSGTSLVPLHYSKPDHMGLVEIFSFGVGYGLMSLFISVASCVYHRELRYGRPASESIGIIGGLFWGSGNVLSIVASDSSLGVGIAMPIRESYVIICSIAAIFMFGEMKHASSCTRIQFATAVLVVIVGMFTLAVFGDPRIGGKIMQD